MIGFAPEGTNLKTVYVGNVANSWSYYAQNGTKYISGANSAFGPPAKKGDNITVHLDVDTTIVKYFKNGSLMGYISGIQNNF